MHAQPGAKKAALRGLHGDAVKLAVKAAAQDGRANQAIVAFVAEALDIPKSDVEISSGQSSRHKRLLIRGDAGDIRRRLESWLA